jgi:lysophospholipid hydrolase
MSLDQDKSFYCVVDGMVQVFAQTGQPTKIQRGSWDEEDTNGYQLLNEVGSGGTLSSLFTILSLFTEDVKMSWKDNNEQSRPISPVDSVGSSTASVPNGRHRSQRADSDVSHLDLPSSRSHVRRSSESSSASTIHVEGIPRRFEASPPARTENYGSFPHQPSPQCGGSVHIPTQIHHGVVARATEDTTLAVIPAEAFRRLTKKYPKATGHIVQGKEALNT